VDLVVENRGQLIPIEVKWSERISLRDVTGLRIFLSDFREEAPWGLVLYRGKQLLRLQRNLFLVPLDRFL